MSIVFQVAVPVPLPRLFDYTPPRNWDGAVIPPGTRVLVPFSRRSVVGCVMGSAANSELPSERLRPITRIIDPQPLLSTNELSLLRWAADYYHYPLGEAVISALPVLLRRARSVEEAVRRYELTEAGRAQNPDDLAKRALRQQQLLAWLQAQTVQVNGELLNGLGWQWRTTLRALVKKGWLVACDSLIVEHSPAVPGKILHQSGPSLNCEQEVAVAAVAAALDGCFAPSAPAQRQPKAGNPFLLEGVTGSGKTEVYLRLIQKVLEQSKQVLILLPEIALTPQLEARFRERFAVPVGVFHSGLADTERLRVWLAAQRGTLPILLGTRSAVFTPMPNLALVLVDEEHDSSFKQQDGFRFHARDVAVMRARMLNIPILLGSATPSLESCFNAQRGRYQRLLLPKRAGGAAPPLVRLVDLRNQQLDSGMSLELQNAVTQVLNQGEQALLFLNRRGYAPVLICHACGWVGRCRRCDANYVVHAGDKRLRCHHCGADGVLPKQCPNCASDDLRPLGLGTERLEQTLRRLYPNVGIARVDRDSIRRKGELERILDEVHSGRVRLLLGTQMLAKGHHFPNVTLVGVLDVDGGLYSIDFRAGERLAQLIVQVAGRAGRGDKPGTVLLQTHCPEHPLLHSLLNEGYSGLQKALVSPTKVGGFRGSLSDSDFVGGFRGSLSDSDFVGGFQEALASPTKVGGFVRDALSERQAAGLPPYTFQALLRAESTVRATPLIFFQQLNQWISQQQSNVITLGPAPAPRERLAGRYRWQLLLQSPRRESLHRLLHDLNEYVDSLLPTGKPRWSIDVDPVDLF